MTTITGGVRVTQPSSVTLSEIQTAHINYGKQRIGTNWYVVKYVNGNMNDYKCMDGAGIHFVNAHLGKLKKGLIKWSGQT